MQKTFGEHWSVGSRLSGFEADKSRRARRQPEPAHGGTTCALGRTLTQQVPNPLLWPDSADHRRSDGPTIARAATSAAVSAFHTVALLSQQRRPLDLSFVSDRAWSADFRGGLTFTRRLHVLKADRRRRRGVRCGDSDRARPPTFQVADSFNDRLEKDESTGNVPHIVFSGSLYGKFRLAAGRRWNLSGWQNAVAGGWQLAGIVRLQSGSPLAVTQATNFNAFAGFGIQRPNRVGDPELAFRTSAPPAAGSTRPHLLRRRNSRSASSRAIPLSVPDIGRST